MEQQDYNNTAGGYNYQQEESMRSFAESQLETQEDLFNLLRIMRGYVWDSYYDKSTGLRKEGWVKPEGGRPLLNEAGISAVMPQLSMISKVNSVANIDANAYKHIVYKNSMAILCTLGAYHEDYGISSATQLRSIYESIKSHLWIFASRPKEGFLAKLAGKIVKQTESVVSTDKKGGGLRL